MNDINILLWLFPILFIFHHFEEIILTKSWIHKNRLYLWIYSSIRKKNMKNKAKWPVYQKQAI
ncbi:HXXEE domain-containing protein [Clostridium sp. SHJSY1]|uniref:HXXEE domain-containing protein n=1 Tax=Clostridium sp. SHJSY1 TaxID=2942483 RepID=UPI002876FD38|nr:HXXEE domain-containing protein [Clostridium sp. SHJSY1]MDS0527617.1 HXXEE domain-containing protein [Clostridium sp. SHJSY1]